MLCKLSPSAQEIEKKACSSYQNKIFGGVTQTKETIGFKKNLTSKEQDPRTNSMIVRQFILTR